MRGLPGDRRRGNEGVKLLVINMFVHWASQILTLPIHTLRVPEGVCLWLYSRSPVIVAIRTGPNNLLPNVMLQPFNDAPNSFGSQSDGRQGSNFFSAHSLPEVEPKNPTIALLVGSGQAMLQVFIDFLQKNFESDSLFTPMDLFPRLGVDIARGNMGFVAAG